MQIKRGDRPSSAIPLARPAVHEDDIRALEQCLRATDLGTGSQSTRLEARLAELTGRAHAMAVNSDASALELALIALTSPLPGAAEIGMRQPAAGRQVLVPAAGFPRVASAVVRAGAELVPVDLDPDTWNMDAVACSHALTPRTLAAISVDANGLVADSRGMPAQAHAAGVWLVDDAAASLGGFDEHGVAGAGYGDLITLSFHAHQPVSALEGGAVLCDLEPLAQRIRALGGLDPGLGPELGPDQAITNARLSDLGAALALSQLDRLHAQVSERRLLVRGYRERLADMHARGVLSFQRQPDEARPAWTRCSILLAENLPRRAGHPIDRARICATLASRGIATGPAAFAVHRSPAFAHLPGVAGRQFPVAQALHDRGLSLPLFSGMRSAELDRVCEALAELLGEALS